jgi:UDP-N-acetylglucosamine:LPS N-acetylglucosamine transferase
VKVLNLIEEGRVGGPQLRILSVTPHLVFLGVKTTVILPQKNSSDFQKRLSGADIPFKTAHLTTMRRHPKSLFAYAVMFLPELFSLTMLIRRQKPDLVHVSGGSWQIKGILAGRFAGCKVVWHLNDTQTPKVLKLLFRTIQPLAQAFITAGHRVQEYYLPNEIKRPIFNISAPVDCSFFDPALVQKTTSDDV